MSWLSIAAIVIGIGYLLLRRLLGQRVQVKSLLVLPLILTVIGANELRGTAFTTPTVLLIGAGAALSVILGLLRGVSIHFANRDGQLWMRYRGVTIALWLLNIVAKLALLPLEHVLGVQASAGAAGQSILLSIGLGILAESAVVYLRASRAADRLSAELVWSVDRDGSTRPAPSMDGWREQRRAFDAGRPSAQVSRAQSRQASGKV